MCFSNRTEYLQNIFYIIITPTKKKTAGTMLTSLKLDSITTFCSSTLSQCINLFPFLYDVTLKHPEKMFHQMDHVFSRN